LPGHCYAGRNSSHLRLQQKLFADPRRIALLKQIEQTGSISQGAKNAGISYKSAWDAINEMNSSANSRWWTEPPAAKAAAARC
jgi:molybdenum-dependent DNA-binding transcriptional regulator ModE